eukprot:COSAG05_NODE_3049_length_2383_cov_2.662434_3_plen_85_part_00
MLSIEAGKAILLGGLAAVEHGEGVPLTAKVFVAESVVVHVTAIERVDAIRRRCAQRLFRAQVAVLTSGMQTFWRIAAPTVVPVG